MLLCFLQKVREVLKCPAKGEKGDMFLFKVARYRVINPCCCDTDLEAFLQAILSPLWEGVFILKFPR